ncbi:hypothetical protein [Streptosporangium amethystogenes]|uniref:hypothetical protein n=1 Tax=Streptosporangium amethystogenes TaxID=2002 RepID=UPI0004C5489D|nr:hypothetical protein [Streptosporangium amethystogenes]
MEQFIASLEQARKVIGEETARVLNLLSSVDADRSAALPIREIEGWLDQEIPRLRKRNQMIQESDSLADWAPGLTGLGPPGPTPSPGGLMAFDERDLATHTLANDEGKKLAETLVRLSGTGPHSSGNDYDRAFAQLADRRGDADFTAGVFAALGPKGAAAVLRELNHYRGESARKHWKTMGEALAAAVARRPKSLGPAWEPENLGKAQGADLGLLLGHGRFPTGWLTEVVRPRVRKSPGDEVLARWTADLSHFLSALANNPETARALFNDLPREELRDLFSELNAEVSLYPNEYDPIAFDLEAEFGRMLAAGAGVFEKRSPGPGAVRFAFNAMTTMGDLRTGADFRNPEGQPMDVAKGARVFLSMLAGAYAAEMMEGASFRDANRTKDSVFEKTDTLILGLSPKFVLSPGDTYRFMKTFADSAEHMKPFEEGMGKFARHLMDSAAVKDQGKNVEYLGRAFIGMGYLAGMQIAATNEAQGKMDEYDQKARDRIFFLLGLGVDATGFGAAGLGLLEESFQDFIWLMISKSTTETIDSYKDIDGTRLDKLKETNRLATLGSEYWIFHELRRYGFSYKVPPTDPAFSQPPITGADGTLLPFSMLAKDPKALKNLADWLISNGSGSGDKSTAGEAAAEIDILFTGAKGKTRDNPAPWG